MRSWVPMFFDITSTRATNLVAPAISDAIGCLSAKAVDQFCSFRRKCREWQSYLTYKKVAVGTASCLGVIFAVANLPPAIQTNYLAQWTAKKDFREWCANEEASNHTISLECETALSHELRPPPVIRHLNDNQPATVAQPNTTSALITEDEMAIKNAGFAAFTILTILVLIVGVLVIFIAIRAPYSSSMRQQRQLSDVESSIGWPHQVGKVRRPTIQSSSPSTAISSSNRRRTPPLGMRSRIPYAHQQTSIKAEARKEYERNVLEAEKTNRDTLKEYESRYLEAERTKAEQKLDVMARDAGIFRANGRVFALTLIPQDSFTLQRRSTF